MRSWKAFHQSNREMIRAIEILLSINWNFLELWSLFYQIRLISNNKTSIAIKANRWLRNNNNYVGKLTKIVIFRLLKICTKIKINWKSKSSKSNHIHFANIMSEFQICSKSSTQNKIYDEKINSITHHKWFVIRNYAQ